MWISNWERRGVESNVFILGPRLLGALLSFVPFLDIDMLAEAGGKT